MFNTPQQWDARLLESPAARKAVLDA